MRCIWRGIGKRLKTEARNVYAFACRQNQVKPIAIPDDVERVTNDGASNDGARDSTVEDSIEGFAIGRSTFSPLVESCVLQTIAPTFCIFGGLASITTGLLAFPPHAG